LFCIFLLMPLVQAPAEPPDSDHPSAAAAPGERPPQEPAKPPPDDVQRLQQHLAVRVLEIDAATGKLYYNDPERTEVRHEADAHSLIERDRRALGGARELYYVILYPRDPLSPYPKRGEREQYDRWFKDVAHGPEMPGTAAAGGGQP
jgi:hypothetical protein